MQYVIIRCPNCKFYKITKARRPKCNSCGKTWSVATNLLTPVFESSKIAGLHLRVIKLRDAGVSEEKIKRLYDRLGGD